MVVSPAVGRDCGGGITGGGDLNIPSLEHSYTVHCDQAHYGPVSGGGAAAGFKGVQAVVGSGQILLGGDVNVGSGGGTDVGG